MVNADGIAKQHIIIGSTAEYVAGSIVAAAVIAVTNQGIAADTSAQDAEFTGTVVTAVYDGDFLRRRYVDIEFGSSGGVIVGQFIAYRRYFAGKARNRYEVEVTVSRQLDSADTRQSSGGTGIVLGTVDGEIRYTQCRIRLLLVLAHRISQHIALHSCRIIAIDALAGILNRINLSRSTIIRERRHIRVHFGFEARNHGSGAVGNGVLDVQFTGLNDAGGIQHKSTVGIDLQGAFIVGKRHQATDGVSGAVDGVAGNTHGTVGGGSIVQQVAGATHIAVDKQNRFAHIAHQRIATRGTNFQRQRRIITLLAVGSTVCHYHLAGLRIGAGTGGIAAVAV